MLETDRSIDRPTEWWLYSKKGFYTGGRAWLWVCSLNGHVRTCAVISEYTRITVDKCLWEQMCRCTCVVDAGGHRWIKHGPKDEHLRGLERIDGWLHWTKWAMSQARVVLEKVFACVCWQDGLLQLPGFIYVKWTSHYSHTHLDVSVLNWSTEAVEFLSSLEFINAGEDSWNLYSGGGLYNCAYAHNSSLHWFKTLPSVISTALRSCLCHIIKIYLLIESMMWLGPLNEWVRGVCACVCNNFTTSRVLYCCECDV